MARNIMIKLKPKTYAVGDIIQVDAIIEHPMETGLRKDKDGQLVPAHYINDVKVEFDGKVVTSIDVSQSISVNPFISFNLKVTKNGELKITATDNKGEVADKTIAI